MSTPLAEPPVVPYARWVITALVLLALGTISAVVIIGALGLPNASLLDTTVIGITAPLELSLLGLLMHSVVIHLNSRMTQLMTVVESAARAEGRLVGASEASGVAAETAQRVRAEGAEVTAATLAASEHSIERAEASTPLPKEDLHG